MGGYYRIVAVISDGQFYFIVVSGNQAGTIAVHHPVYINPPRLPICPVLPVILQAIEGIPASAAMLYAPVISCSPETRAAIRVHPCIGAGSGIKGKRAGGRIAVIAKSVYIGIAKMAACQTVGRNKFNRYGMIGERNRISKIILCRCRKVDGFAAPVFI